MAPSSFSTVAASGRARWFSPSQVTNMAMPMRLASVQIRSTCSSCSLPVMLESCDWRLPGLAARLAALAAGFGVADLAVAAGLAVSDLSAAPFAEDVLAEDGLSVVGLADVAAADVGLADLAALVLPAPVLPLLAGLASAAGA